MLEALKSLNIEQRLEYHTLIFVQKLKNGDGPDT